MDKAFHSCRMSLSLYTSDLQPRGLFSLRLCLLPVHTNGNHWCCGVIDFHNQTLSWVLSYQGLWKVLRFNERKQSRVLRAYFVFVLLAFLTISAYLKEEAARLDVTFVRDDWSVKTPKSIPGQVWLGPSSHNKMNGTDCGVFACAFADSVSRGCATFGFSQVSEDVVQFNRRRTWIAFVIRLRVRFGQETCRFLDSVIDERVKLKE